MNVKDRPFHTACRHIHEDQHAAGQLGPPLAGPREPLTRRHWAKTRTPPRRRRFFAVSLGSGPDDCALASASSWRPEVSRPRSRPCLRTRVSGGSPMSIHHHGAGGDPPLVGRDSGGEVLPPGLRMLSRTGFGCCRQGDRWSRARRRTPTRWSFRRFTTASTAGPLAALCYSATRSRSPRAIRVGQ